MHQLQYMKIKYIKLLKGLGIVTKLSVHFKRCQLLKDFKGCCRLVILLFGISFFFGSFFSRHSSVDVHIFLTPLKQNTCQVLHLLRAYLR